MAGVTILWALLAPRTECRLDITRSENGSGCTCPSSQFCFLSASCWVRTQC
ncbi:hypothetical protein PR003_g4881 [Phytophthora rubi]|uniref:Uncharacterized protein n=1 Tax=Phytophthora rubi TaxID=129364 RepID=A0A6A3N0G3_9STRA|nr:hypothetical protein PR002_g5751 [Phytophthora rubi]KAE9050989.1 hypothetical protein PR001_g1879 [Phytophthora rubi]KAE9351441.1 hypothetical protein PR003_g4881 [Phytophthora rubi]